MTRSTDKGRNRPPAVAFLLDMARLSLKAEQLSKLRMPLVIHNDLVLILDCARKHAMELKNANVPQKA